jgi:hypothetical protein
MLLDDWDVIYRLRQYARASSTPAAIHLAVAHRHGPRSITVTSSASGSGMHNPWYSRDDRGSMMRAAWNRQPEQVNMGAIRRQQQERLRVIGRDRAAHSAVTGAVFTLRKRSASGWEELWRAGRRRTPCLRICRVQD